MLSLPEVTDGGMIEVWKGSRNCGYCGRFDPMAMAYVDWEASDIICKPSKK